MNTNDTARPPQRDGDASEPVGEYPRVAQTGLEALRAIRVTPNPIFDEPRRPQIPSLADVADAHFAVHGDGCGCSGITETTGEHIADMWRYSCTITTAHQLDALPQRSVILDADTAVLRRDPWGEFSTVKWHPLDNDSSMDRDFGLDHDEVRLPALLLWHPDWSKS